MVFEDFDINKVRSFDRMSKILSVRITRRDFEWIKKNRISATKLFNYALHKIIFEQGLLDIESKVKKEGDHSLDDDVFEQTLKRMAAKEMKKKGEGRIKKK